MVAIESLTSELSTRMQIWRNVQLVDQKAWGPWSCCTHTLAPSWSLSKPAKPLILKLFDEQLACMLTGGH